MRMLYRTYPSLRNTRFLETMRERPLSCDSLAVSRHINLMSLAIQIRERPRTDRFGTAHEGRLPLRLPVLELQVVEREEVIDVLEAERGATSHSRGAEDDLHLLDVLEVIEFQNKIFDEPILWRFLLRGRQIQCVVRLVACGREEDNDKYCLGVCGEIRSKEVHHS